MKAIADDPASWLNRRPEPEMDQTPEPPPPGDPWRSFCQQMVEKARRQAADQQDEEDGA